MTPFAIALPAVSPLVALGADVTPPPPATPAAFLPRLNLLACVDRAKTKLPTAIRLKLTPAPGVPAKYRNAVVGAADSCKIKKTVAMAPPIVVTIAETAAVTLPSIWSASHSTPL